MKNTQGTPIYIGKAVDLRSRVRSYFSGTEDERIRIAFMHAHLSDIDIVVTNTEEEALILEANYIRTHKPRYNADLKDDKHYPYIKVTVQASYPRVCVVRRVVRDGAEYFGPWTNAARMHQLIRVIRDVFRVRTCTKKLSLSTALRPCVNYAIGKCSGPCGRRISQQQYRENVDMAVAFLKGRHAETRRILRTKMQEAAQGYQYEKAAYFRDMLQLMESAAQKQTVDLHRPDLHCDAFGLVKNENTVCITMLSFSEGILLSTRQFTFDVQRWDAMDAQHDNIVVRIYRSTAQPPPREILLPAGHGFNPQLLEKWVRRYYEKTVQVRIPKRGKKARIVEMAEKNAVAFVTNTQGGALQRMSGNVSDDSSMRASGDNDLLAQLAYRLDMTEKPVVIEAFDISNLGKSHPVAASVRFTNGEPDKRYYRRYRMRYGAGQNDFAMMEEVVSRRLRALQERGEMFPRLLLIDGGRGQLEAACRAAEAFEGPPHIVSLAKREEQVFVPHRVQPLHIDRDDNALLLLRRIRDEVHRFALAYHRSRRDARLTRSSLERIPGVGTHKAHQLLTAFGSVENLRTLSPARIAALPGFSERLARTTLEWLNAENAGQDDGYSESDP
jgi:excinuclease ABC subunit C